ncbi:peptidase [Methylobacterium sp. Leaf87]|uniref:zinc metallopeptidase n=1 Tax=Methylobacterium sp. Leaf87 TaxID=1736243 RepID=UPI0006FC8961|nr:zinc metallopeptidase [Methylobacterium sp. Leaf87]KQO69145.1 peptidase [Methylobacterium sp. Leaf87]
MPVLLALGAALLFGLVFGPQWWVRRAMQQHATERPDLPGTGGELARHLLDLAQLEHVLVEIAPTDHYDPVANVVRLSPGNHDGRSITAVAVAAHEVAHALQHAAGDRLLAARLRFAPVVQGFEFAAAVLMMTAPVVLAFVHSPALLALQVGIGIALLGVRVLFHFLTLPVEFDASFRRALPILETGRYLDAGDMPGARTVLRAAALTYVASSLVALVNIARFRRLLPF